MSETPGNVGSFSAEGRFAAHELETWSAPRPAAAAIPASRLSVELSLVSTRMMWQLGHSAETASRSSDSSFSQLELPLGSGLGAPVWLTLRKQPLAVVQAGSPYLAR